MDTIIQLTILIVLVGLGIFAWRAWQRQTDGRGLARDRTSAPRVSEASIEQVRVGGMIQLPPHGEAMETKDVRITARHIYEEDGFEWIELEGDSGAGTQWLEVAHDDELEASVTLQRLGLHDIDLTPAALQEMEQGVGAKLSFGGRQFAFAEHGRAHFRPGGDAAKTQTLDYWDFEGDDDKHDLGIERWDDEYRVYLSQRIDPARIRIFSLAESG